MYQVCKRIFDIALSVLALVLSFPAVTLAAVAVWIEDRESPFYVPRRIGKGGVPFPMLKLRSMVVDADRSGVDSTAADDPRITRVGWLLRAIKVDEFPQFLNVLAGHMSVVGPRPQVASEVALYTEEERRLLSVRPGVSDFGSIVFGDLNEILRSSTDPNGDYARLVRPWKSRLGLFYLDHRSMFVDLAIIVLTTLSFLSRRLAWRGTALALEVLGAPEGLVRVARRDAPLVPTPLPGSGSTSTGHPDRSS